MRIDLSGKVALVTGSTRGIGRAIAEMLSGAGASVAVTGRDQERADAAASEIAAAHGNTAHGNTAHGNTAHGNTAHGNTAHGNTVRGYACDVSDVAQCTALVEAVERDFSKLDILVNNAGLTRDNLIMRLKDDDWDAVINANLRGAFATCRAASRGMMKRRSGRIVNLASVVGLMGNKGQTNYAASKAGLIGLTKSLAKELGSRGVAANVVAPGYIDTDMTAAMPAEARTALSASIPLERLGTPADIAGMVTFLVSEQASYITGQVFVVDGGLAM